MENFFFKGEADVPTIELAFDKKHFIFSGKSLPEDVDEFYEPIQKQISEFLNTNPESLLLDFELEYFNTASSKKILDIIEMVSEGISNKGNLQINWHYKEIDEDMLEAGEDLQDITELSFTFIKE